jgi:hypothetical protein
MTHEDAGKYAAKHPPETARSERIATVIREKSSGGALACVIGEKISKDLKVDMAEVGITADLLEIKIKECQLGLFGWGDRPGHGKDIRATDSVSVEIRGAVEKAVVNGILTCAAAWRIADQLSIKRKVVSAACDTLGLKIRGCQLGAF